MATLWNTFTGEVMARAAAQGLRGAGVSGRDIQLLTGSRLRDIRCEAVGGFAGPVGPHARVGSFAGVRLRRNHRTGSFASRAHPRRQGSFADTDRDMIVEYRHRAERSRVVGELGLRRFLRWVDLDAAAADRVIDELHAGHAVVVAEVAGIAPTDARARLEQIARAV